MPIISMFYGVIVRMFLGKSEHNPPYFHAYYQDYKAIVDINKCEIVEGSLPPKHEKLVVAWTELHKDEL